MEKTFIISENAWNRISEGRYVLVHVPEDGGEAEAFSFVKSKGRKPAVEVDKDCYFKEPNAYKEAFARAVQTYGFKRACTLFNELDAKSFGEWATQVKEKPTDNGIIEVMVNL